MRAEATEARADIAIPAVPQWACALAPESAGALEVVAAGGARAEVRLSRGRGAGLALASVDGVRGLAADAMRACVADVYRRVLRTLRDGGVPHPVRMWTFLPGIHDHLAPGMDRYRVFNAGRFDAFSEWLGGEAAFEQRLPAASALGHDGSRLIVAALGLETPGTPIENPRQVSAFAYSRAHGPRPPCFARAMFANLPSGPRLLVSGTASIRGEDSLHAGDLQKQLDETFENLGRLAQHARGGHRFELGGADTARVYFARPSDREAVIAGVAARMAPTTALEFVPALVCRAELLVEIEATLVPA